MKDNIQRVIETYDWCTLRRILRVLTAEILAAIAAGERGTVAHLGRLEMIDVIGHHLYEHGQQLDSPPYVDVCIEDGIRYPMQVRVF